MFCIIAGAKKVEKMEKSTNIRNLDEIICNSVERVNFLPAELLNEVALTNDVLHSATSMVCSQEICNDVFLLVFTSNNLYEEKSIFFFQFFIQFLVCQILFFRPSDGDYPYIDMYV